MAVPDFQTLMLPVLRAAANGPVPTAEIVRQLEDAFDLTIEERSELLPSGKQTRMANRVHWAASYLSQAGLVQRPARGVIEASQAGHDIVNSPPPMIDKAFLEQFPSYQEFLGRSANAVTSGANTEKRVVEITATPDEIIRQAHEQIQSTLGKDLLDRIHASPPRFFEELIVDLLVRMGYGSGSDTGRAIGQSGDDGVDGVINLDPLGVDQVYFQAKRYQPSSSIGAGALRDFFGALAMQDVTKGIFVTTSHFTPSARDTAQKLSKRIVLIDGSELARLLIKHSVGCRIVETFPVSVIDESYFE